MANGINLGEALVSLIGGFSGGYGRGRTYRADRQTAEDERQRKIANEQKVFEKRQQEINEQVAGKKEAFGLLNTVGGLSPQTPAEEVLKIKAQYLDAADRGGMSVKEAQDIFDEAVKFSRPQQVSPLDRTKLSLEEQRLLTEKEQTGATAALTKQREAAAERYKALTAQAKDKAKQLKAEDLVSSINALRLQRAQLVDKFGNVIPGREAEYDEIQIQLDAYNKENATRKGVTIPQQPETKKEKIKVDY